MKSAIAVASIFFSLNAFSAPYPVGTPEDYIVSSDYTFRDSTYVLSGPVSWGFDGFSFNLLGIAGLASVSNVYSGGSHATIADTDPYTPTQTISWTVGSGQVGFDGVIDWNGTQTDFVVVWDVTSEGFSTTYTPTDVDSDGITGLRLVNGPFQGYNFAVDAVTSVPEPETWGLMLCGLAFVGWSTRRRIQ
jgi:hypothetical protein